MADPYVAPDFDDIEIIYQSDPYVAPDFDDIQITMAEPVIGFYPRQNYCDLNYMLSVPYDGWTNLIYSMRIGNEINEVYHLPYPIDNPSYVDIIYGLKLSMSFVEYYGDSPVIKNYINEFYSDHPLLVRYFDLKYGDSIGLISALIEQYNISKTYTGSVDIKYSITEEPVLNFLDGLYRIMDTNFAKNYLDQIYAINADSVIESSQLEIYLDDVRIYPFHVNFEINRNSFKAFAEIHVADQESYLLAIENQSVLRIHDGVDDLYFQVEVPRELATPGETTYMIPAESKNRILERADTLTEEFDSAMASVIASEIAGRYGITVDWQCHDWLVKPDTLYANDETPHQVIKKLAEVVQARLQPTASGDLQVVRNMEVDSNQWDSAAPTYYMTDQRNFFQTSEDVAERGGYRKYRISDHLQANYNAYLDTEDITSTTKKIKGYKVPYTGRNLILGHSGGSWVTIESFGWTEEQITETIEIIQGSGSVAFPIYDLDAYTYKQTSLGAITYNEDGTLTTAVVGQSLVEVTYTTKYWLWHGTDPNIEDVQFWLEEAEA